MRIFITITLMVCSMLAVFGHNLSDTVKVYFYLNDSRLNPDFGENKAVLDAFSNKVKQAAASDGLDSLVIYGYTSPDGAIPLNDRLAEKRAQSITDYLVDSLGIDSRYVKIRPAGIAWDELRSIVAENFLVPERERVLEVLDDPSLHYYSTSQGRYIDKRKESLMNIDDCEPYMWMLANIFPQMRMGMGVAMYCTSDSTLSSAPYPTDSEIEVTDYFAETEDVSDARQLQKRPKYTCDQDLALKTNLLYYGILMPNVELEWLINKHWSVAVEANVAWWGSYNKDKSYRLAIFDAEMRWWIRPRSRWHGLYLGAFGGGGLYDLENGRGKHGDGGMAGLSFGYMWPISNNLSLEAGIGAGYMHTQYKEYRPYEGHHLYERTKSLNYFGPLKVKFSLVWRFLNINKRQVESEAL